MVRDATGPCVVCGTTDSVRAYPRVVPICELHSWAAIVPPIDTLVEHVNLCHNHMARVKAADATKPATAILGWCHTCGWRLSGSLCDCGISCPPIRSRFA
jgi:hypothetical protein